MRERFHRRWVFLIDLKVTGPYLCSTEPGADADGLDQHRQWQELGRGQPKTL